MDREVNLSRRPLKTLVNESLLQPNKESSLANRMRRRFDEPFKPSVRNRGKRNREERDRYKKRMPQRQDGRRNNPNLAIGVKRKAVDTRMGMRLRGPSAR